MQIPFVDLKSQYDSIKEEIDASVAGVISESAFVGGRFVQSFESSFARYCNTEHCVGVGNGTDALFIALKALGIGPGHEVLVPANTFIATSEAATLTGASVVFVDIVPETYHIDVEKIRARLTPKTRAIVPVHLYGQPVDMDPILSLAREYNLIVVEDAAQAHGAVYKDRRVGTFGDVACFSFYPGKNLGAYGDAGAIVTNSGGLAQRCRMLANHGRADKYNHEMEGVNSRLDGLQAAVLEVKLRHLEKWSERRRRNAQLYSKYLSGVAVRTPKTTDDVKGVYHLYVIRVDKTSRKGLQAYLSTKGIATGIHYPIALPFLKAYAHLGHTPAEFPEAFSASNEVLSLPMFSELEEGQIRYVAETIGEFLS